MEELRQKAHRLGIASLSLAELLALITHNRHTPPESSYQIAEQLLNYFEDVEALTTATPDTLTTLPGITPLLAYRLLAALELGRRLTFPVPESNPVIRHPSDAVVLFRNHVNTHNQEQLFVMLLDINNRMMEIETIYIGSLNTTVVRVPEILRPAIAHNAAGLIIAHNHPSGDTTPSEEDIQITARLVEAGKLLDIAILDHLIIGGTDWFSLRENGLGF